MPNQQEIDLKYAQSIAKLLVQKHFPKNKDWQALGNMNGVLTQIDNITSCLVKPEK